MMDAPSASTVSGSGLPRSLFDSGRHGLIVPAPRTQNNRGAPEEQSTKGRAGWQSLAGKRRAPLLIVEVLQPRAKPPWP